jgi:D-alanyl-lipoteichoic acid acyltransferase DltB (MBOAT superfamily)
MLFNSFEFFLFLPIVFILYWFVFNRRLGLQNALVLFASYFFYGWWSWKFLALLVLSTLLDYGYGFFVASPNRKKAKLFLWLSILNNLGILAVFKYYNFFAGEFSKLFNQIGWHTNPLLLQVALPIGISFYTFHGMSYVFDIYRGKQQPVRNFVDYAVFVSFFPLLVAGPIERAGHLLPQVQKSRLFNYNQAVEGCRLILWGLFKKVVIADNLAGIADQVFNNPGEHGSFSLILGAVAFSFQIYGDFSGYSDIALGTAKLFGFELLSNFRFPYFSRDIAEFWRRWHISLSSWFRDYLYIPLGGSKNGKWKAVRNTFFIFLVSGFWHGASWNFIAWGGIHAVGFLPLLLLNRNRANIGEVVAANSMLPTLKEFGQMLLTFTFVTFAWIFFRAESIGAISDYFKAIIQGIGNLHDFFTAEVKGEIALFYIIPFLAVEWYLRQDERRLVLPASVFLRSLVYLVVSILIFFNWGKNSSFIYFEF